MISKKTAWVSQGQICQTSLTSFFDTVIGLVGTGEAVDVRVRVHHITNAFDAVPRDVPISKLGK